VPRHSGVEPIDRGHSSSRRRLLVGRRGASRWCLQPSRLQVLQSTPPSAVVLWGPQQPLRPGAGGGEQHGRVVVASGQGGRWRACCNTGCVERAVAPNTVIVVAALWRRSLLGGAADVGLDDRLSRQWGGSRIGSLKCGDAAFPVGGRHRHQGRQLRPRTFCAGATTPVWPAAPWPAAQLRALARRAAAPAPRACGRARRLRRHRRPARGLGDRPRLEIGETRRQGRDPSWPFVGVWRHLGAECPPGSPGGAALAGRAAPALRFATGRPVRRRGLGRSNAPGPPPGSRVGHQPLVWSGRGVVELRPTTPRRVEFGA